MKFFFSTLLILFWSQFAVAEEGYDYPALLKAIETPTLLRIWPGKLQIQMISYPTGDISLQKYSELSPEDRILDRINKITELTPEGMELFLRKLEVAVFGKAGMIELGLSKQTEGFVSSFAERRITLNKASFYKYTKLANEPQALWKFVIAHEFAHFVIYNYELVHGKTPSSFISAFAVGLSADFPESKLSALLLRTAYAGGFSAHAEVDVMACLLLKKMSEPITSEYFELAQKLETNLDINEFKTRIQAIEDCRRH